MAMNRTPPHQRIARAEKAREEWKMKAVERRVENEKLKKDLKYKNMILIFKAENQTLKAENQALKQMGQSD